MPATQRGVPLREGCYRLGLPAWAFPGWQDEYFTDRPSVLGSYASVFNTVEGNTTFYQTPTARTVRKWGDSLAGHDFHLSLKLPREITHEGRASRRAIDGFFGAVDALGEHLGPFLVQFPAKVGPDAMGGLLRLFDAFPRSHRYVIEVRHPAWFEDPGTLEPLLDRFRLGRVCLDSRPIYQGDQTNPDVQAALHKKPDLPILSDSYHGISYFRLILHPEHRYNAAVIAEWVQRLSCQLTAGDAVYAMIHCPNNQHCPMLAKDFHETLRAQPSAPHLPALPEWPVAQQVSLL